MVPGRRGRDRRRRRRGSPRRRRGRRRGRRRRGRRRWTVVSKAFFFLSLSLSLWWSSAASCQPLLS